MPPYAELSQERMGVWKRTHLFLRGGVMTVMDMKIGFAESGYCLIDFTRNYVLWGFFKKISQNHLTEGSDPASVHLVFLGSKLLPLCSRQRMQARRIRDLCPCKGDEALLNRIQLFFL